MPRTRPDGLPCVKRKKLQRCGAHFWGWPEPINLSRENPIAIVNCDRWEHDGESVVIAGDLCLSCALCEELTSDELGAYVNAADVLTPETLARVRAEIGVKVRKRIYIDTGRRTR